MLTNLRLRDFRGFENLAVDLGSGANFFLGPNGQGQDDDPRGGARSAVPEVSPKIRPCQRVNPEQMRGTTRASALAAISLCSDCERYRIGRTRIVLLLA